MSEIELKTLKRPIMGSGLWRGGVYWKGAFIGCFTVYSIPEHGTQMYIVQFFVLRRLLSSLCETITGDVAKFLIES